MWKNNNQQGVKSWCEEQRQLGVEREIDYLHRSIDRVVRKQQEFRQDRIRLQGLRKHIGDIKDNIRQFEGEFKNTQGGCSKIKGVWSRLLSLKKRAATLECKQQVRELEDRRGRCGSEELRRAGQDLGGEGQGALVSGLREEEIVVYFQKLYKLRARQDLIGDEVEWQLVDGELRETWEELKERFIKRSVSEEVTQDYRDLVELVQTYCVKLFKRQEDWGEKVRKDRQVAVTFEESRKIGEFHSEIQWLEEQQNRYIRLGTWFEWLDRRIQGVSVKIQQVRGEEEKRPGVSRGYRGLIQIVQRRLQGLCHRQLRFREELAERDTGNEGESNI